ncbi:dinitrogenase reductase [bacterium (Candidatus Blackallbacteria) CG17_big_fil_post_rev_8_21_14_2_50_48_46]|uniref:Dinitrogenase reductase n=1 Tax=bacterium (Candidatus Blackallbacteria) CG17_big_fil_post_rev_8_21_14_2_50_48_46 TaxID=2014261 RepID=A0A2M7FZU3_9BACT|nr:MAG: dinitrogenase reductase [bacterium (Candidatus Blackallbacteria) CG18_big_fil_WC_8_21_14_2_50_49_26]PIW14798.1 MAG: dinitrogenase reductase [bacterium (Candidatus Blackallbacteria) CG17_big_fil_post_rev_8_21_14_2_50_48_46]PIW50900.1 MAG: dinitrogenase reductase [bacterium (Candidatus Blackallbacteria) CG13_big_fil_rev_8_21_14_2_50_49_14]
MLKHSIENPERIQSALTGCLLGTALGDALGLPSEGLSYRRQHAMFPDLEHYHFIFRRGMFSDDTEHLTLVAQALIGAQGNPAVFARKLSWKLRFWLLGLPAGIGLSTLQGIIRLWLGISPLESGVFSAGNGPAMRASLLGILFLEEPDVLKHYNRISTRMTHTDPRAEFGALVLAVAAGMAARSDHVEPREFYQQIRQILPEEAHDLLLLMEQAVRNFEARKTLSEFLAGLKCENGISGYIYHTVPAVIYTWFKNQGNFRRGVSDIIRCGGDTDTTGALLGGIIGAQIGHEKLPSELLKRLWEWPRNVEWIQALGERLGQTCLLGEPQPELPLNWPGVLLRNFVFLLIVIIHGFRRFLPPYK